MKKGIVLLIIVLFSCSKNKEEKVVLKKKQTESSLKIRSEKPIIKSQKKDSLNNKNTIAFFVEYGKQNKETTVEFNTRLGNFTVKLFNDTPIHRANFIFLAKSGYFDITSFHRLVPGFVAQFGNSDHIETAKFRKKYKEYRLTPEFKKKHKHKYGALAVARNWDYNPNKLSTPFEFYVVQNKKGEHHLNFEHTVFGEVIKGMRIIDEIILEKTDTDEWPFIDVNLKTISIK